MNNTSISNTSISDPSATDPSMLAARIAALRGVRVLCVGDVMLDRFVYGEVERISPEAPIPIVRVRRETAMLGGAGNVVRNLVALGVQAHFMAAVGDDAAGSEIARLIAEQGGIDPDLLVESGRQTTIKTRFFAGSQQMLRVDRETSDPLGPLGMKRILASVDAAITTVGAVSLSDYGKGVLTPALIAALIARARQHGKPVVVDPKGGDYSIYRGATLVTPNRKELQGATRMPVETESEIVAAARSLIERCGIENVLVTRSQDGMTLVSGPQTNGTGTVFHLPAVAREVFDVSGAGDTVVAMMSSAIAAGADLAEAARLSNIAAGIVVAKVGTAAASADEVVAALHHSEIATGEAKVMSRDGAAARVELWRRAGLKVGFTNGCFDLLHPGHVSLIAQARSKCDRLVLGINSDASVQRLKGPDRPVQSEAARATVLASLAGVDLVVIFDEETPLQLIETLRPDLLVKGADYTIDKVVGADLVKSWGGSVYLAELSPGHSTTATIARIFK